MYPARFPLPMRAQGAQFLVELVSWAVLGIPPPFLYWHMTLWAVFSFLFEKFSKVYLMIPLFLLQKRPQLPNNLHKKNCCERWSILRPWVCWRFHCLTRQVVLEPIGSDLSFSIGKGFLGSGFWQYLRLLNILANLILSKGHM